MLTKYKVSEKEIIRRKKAFLSLCISLFLGTILASKLLNFPISLYVSVALAIILLFFNLWLKTFFNKYLIMKTYLSKKYLIRGKGKYLTKNIIKIKIKRTTQNTIREVYLYFVDGKKLFINGLDNFENFGNNLLKKINKNTTIINIREPMNFDSIFFYPILGLILSIGTIYFLKSITDFNYQTTQIILYISVIYIILMGIYFIISKPISKRY